MIIRRGRFRLKVKFRLDIITHNNNKHSNTHSQTTKPQRQVNRFLSLLNHHRFPINLLYNISSVFLYSTTTTTHTQQPINYNHHVHLCHSRSQPPRPGHCLSHSGPRQQFPALQTADAFRLVVNATDREPSSRPRHPQQLRPYHLQRPRQLHPRRCR